MTLGIDDTPTGTATLSHLIGLIYDCALDPQLWERTLAEIRRALGFCNAMFTIWTAPSGQPLLNVTSGIEPHYADRIAEFGPAIVEHWGGAAAIAAFEVGEPKVLSWERADPAWPDSAYYREWVAPQKITDLMAVAVTRDSGLYCSIGLARHEAEGPIAEREVEMIRLLVPHVRRAVAISRLLDIATVTGTTFRAVLDAMPTPVLVLDDALGIVHANQSGRALLAMRDGLYEDRGRLAFSSPQLTQTLRSAIGKAGDGDDRQSMARSLPLARDAGPALIHVLPLRPGALRADLVPSATTALFIATDAARQALSPDAVAGLFGLTPAEARVLATLAGGSTLADAAQHLDVSIGTVRTHLSRLFFKTGTNRQAELVRLARSLSL
ncbi:MAG: LuxR C-terminal-related transcriptional regulator [Rubrivivax sp.]